MSAGGAAAAAAAAAEMQRQEEEEMTKYSDADLHGDWEFKIVRSNLAGFKNPEVLQQVCAEEARAGWTLVEKFDNQRLRFKRPISARAGDAGLEFDPYRSQVGASSGAIVAVVVAGILLVALAIPLLVVILVKK
jgi:hypothetical protein